MNKCITQPQRTPAVCVGIGLSPNQFVYDSFDAKTHAASEPKIDLACTINAVMVLEEIILNQLGGDLPISGPIKPDCYLMCCELSHKCPRPTHADWAGATMGGQGGR